MSFEDFVFYFVWGCAWSVIRGDKPKSISIFENAIEAAWLCRIIEEERRVRQ